VKEITENNNFRLQMIYIGKTVVNALEIKMKNPILSTFLLWREKCSL